jgi:hypothetical protein
MREAAGIAMISRLIKAIRKSERIGQALPAPVKAIASRGIARLHSHYHTRLYKRMVSQKGYADLERYVSRRIVPLKAPVALISQLERSGGSLLSQMFDGHPQVAAYPAELRFGPANKDRWPARLDTFRDAADVKMQKLLKHGFSKGKHEDHRRSLLISPRIQKLIFDRLEKRTPRDTFDAFFTSFFNAWLNYREDLEDKILITAFAPRIALDAENVSRFFSVYPDGYLIQVRRDFDSWSRSARPFYAAMGRTVPDSDLKARWAENMASIERNRRAYGERVLAVEFGALRKNAAAAMAELTARLPIAFHDCLTQPTFNGRLTWANSSFTVASPGLIGGDEQAPDPLLKSGRAKAGMTQ